MRFRMVMGLWISALGALGLGSHPGHAQTPPPSVASAGCDLAETQRLVRAALSKWRSQYRAIPGGLVREQSETFIPSSIRGRLADCRQDLVIEALRQGIADSTMLVDRNVAANLLKIHQIAVLNRRNIRPFINPYPGNPIPAMQDEIKGLTQQKLDQLLKGFPEAEYNALSDQGFDLRNYMLAQESLKSAINNDKYAFTTPGILFSLGLHESAEVVFELSSRGHDSYPYLVSAGQDQVIDMLENLHFEQWQIDLLRNEIEKDFKIDPGFWTWLKNWRFRGKVRAVPVGTVVFPGEPILQVIADPVSALIVESLINPWMSTMTNLMTNATQILVAADGIPVTEAGTRRLQSGLLSAISASLAGAQGTSNVLAAWLMGVPAYGTSQHAFTGMFDTEFDALDALFSHYKNPGVYLPDTIEIQDGVRMAKRAGGGKAKTARQDSNIVVGDQNLSTIETALALQEIQKSLDGGEAPAFLTNDLDLDAILEVVRSKLKTSTLSIGGGFAAPKVGHGNMVYKLVEYRKLVKGAVARTVYPIKIANKAKATNPGEKDLMRLSDPMTGQFIGDEVLSVTEPRPNYGESANADSLIRTAFEGLKRKMKRARPDESAPFIASQLKKLSPELVKPKTTVKELQKQGREYPVRFSDALRRIKSDAIVAHTPKKENRTLVVFGTFSPFLENTHLLGIERAIELMKDRVNATGYDRVVIVPAGDRPVHGKKPRLKGEVRAEQARKRVRKLSRKLGIPMEVWEGEIQSQGAYTYDTLAAIRAAGDKDAQYTLLFGEDAFWSIGSEEKPWKEADRLLSENKFHVLTRGSGSFDSLAMRELKAETSERLKRFGFVKRENAWTKDGEVRVQFQDARLTALSSTAARNFYDIQGIVALTHITDPQWTFATRRKTGLEIQKTDGSLAVEGTELTVDNVAATMKAALESGKVKLSFSGDAHFEIEMKDPAQNGEFHDKPNFKSFPAHGMDGWDGPRGDAPVEEVQKALVGREVIVIPAHEPASAVSDDGTRTEKLKLVDFDIKKIGPSLRDPESVLKFKKNGVGSYSVHVNPHYQEYLALLDPSKLLPHFHGGWCSDFCTYFAAKEELELGYDVFMIIDTMAGVYPKLTGMRLRELMDSGATFLTAAEYRTLTREWKEKDMGWDEVVNQMHDFKKTSTTQAWLKRELSHPRYADLSPGENEALGQCSVMLRSESGGGR